MSEVVAFINELRKRKDIAQYSEADTKQSIILRLLSLLGWSPFDPEEVKPEYVVGNRRVDYALRLHSIPKVFIEAKKIDERLSDYEEQLVSYATTESVKLAILTNGITWWFYLPLVEGKWDQKKFYSIDILEQDPAHAAEKSVKFLSKSSTVSGESIALAEAVFKDRQKDDIIAGTLPKAWNKLIEEPEEILVVLLKETAEKLCGYEIPPETIKRFLEQRRGDLLLAQLSSLRPQEDLTSTGDKTRERDNELSDEEFSRRDETTLRVVINWHKVGKPEGAEILENERGVRIFLRVLDRLARCVGKPKFEELLNFPVNRGKLLSRERTKYHKKPLQGYFVLTYNATDEKAEILRDVVKYFNLPPDFLQVEVVEVGR